jgi:NADH dehydrogenase
MAAPIPSASPRPRVVVIGAGHAGLEASKALADEPVEVLMVDRNNYHKFQPLLYQVATAGLQTGHICMPVRQIFRDQDNFDFRMATVVGADFDGRLLRLENGEAIPYDYLIVGAGGSTAFFGVEGAEEHGFPLKNVPDAEAIRSHVLQQFERANRAPHLIGEGALTFVVVGGGPTGVEMAGALRELFDQVLRKDYPHLPIDRARVILVEAGPVLMAPYKDSLRQYTKEALEKMGVEVRLNTPVTRVEADRVRFGDDETVQTQTLVWGAGIRANPLADALGLAQTRAGRLEANDCLQATDHPEVFVAGDVAGATDPEGRLYPQVAQVAIQQGIRAAKNVARMARDLPPEPFRYNDLGSMATIGRNKAILELPNGTGMKGFVAWLGWVFIHVVKLAGFRNQLAVFFSWVYGYFTWDRTPRIILKDVLPERDDLPTAPPPSGDGTTADEPVAAGWPAHQPAT